jgi:hypothetical protein
MNGNGDSGLVCDLIEGHTKDESDLRNRRKVRAHAFPSLYAGKHCVADTCPPGNGDERNVHTLPDASKGGTDSNSRHRRTLDR